MVFLADFFFFFFSSRRRHTRYWRDWSSDVCSSDLIRGFTQMSEGTAAEVIVEMLNEYFEPMVETLFKYEGTLDKFMGDGIMAFWGAPLAHRDDAVRCVQCAIDQMEMLGRFNRQRIG